MNFSEIIGHENIVSQLKGSIQQQRLNQATLFCGLGGIGKRSLINVLAATLLCLNRDNENAEPCGQCKSCHAFNNNNHPDFIILEEEKNEISVAEMRDFCREINKKPVISRNKACFIPNAENMNVASANCFLKTLEEPPENTYIILRASSTEQLLKTIISRCQIIRMAPLNRENIIKILAKKHGISGEKAQMGAEIAEGSVKRAIELCEGTIAENFTWLRKRLQSLRPADALKLSDWLIEQTQGKNNHETRKKISQLLDMIALIYRLSLKGTPVPRDPLKKLDIIWDAAHQIDRNVTPEIVLRNMALVLCQS